MYGKKRLSSRVVLYILTAMFWVVVLVAPAAPGSAPLFFEGKTIRFVVGTSPGGGFDTFARLLARHFGRYIPGQPKMIVQNRPGAGSLVAANRVYAMQPGDGLTIVTFSAGLLSLTLVGDSVAKFDPLKYLWLGEPSIGALPLVLWVRGDLPIRSVDDLRRRKEPLPLGATRFGSTMGVSGEFLRYLGLPVKNVYGYKGTRPVMAALERKELDGVILSQTSAQTFFSRFIDEGLIRPIISLGTEPRVQPLQGVATLEVLKLNPDQRKLVEFLTRIWRMLRLYAIPPGTPPERVRVLREAFRKTLESPELRKDAKRLRVIVSPRSGKEVSRDIRSLTQAPPEIIETFREFLGLKR